MEEEARDSAERGRTERHRLPVARGTYSDRTAWILAILSEIAYTPFAAENEPELIDLASDLAASTCRGQRPDRLASFRKSLLDPGAGEEAKLRSILEFGGFELIDTLYDRATDTHGFVALRRFSGTGMVAVCFRGTDRMHDWKTALGIRKVPFRSRHGSGGKAAGRVHRGFHRAYMSVDAQLSAILRKTDRLPVYLAGHSLGGALAMLAALCLPGERLAACYTYGAPRVGDDMVAASFRIPVYRVVNRADPVTILPVSGWMACLKSLARLLSFLPVFDRMSRWLLRRQSYVHFGLKRMLARRERDLAGNERLEADAGGAGRIAELSVASAGLLKGKYRAAIGVPGNHHIAEYRVRLRERALRWQEHECGPQSIAFGLETIATGPHA